MHAYRREPSQAMDAGIPGQPPVATVGRHRRRVLFIAPAAGIEGIRRTAALACALDASAWEVLIAAPLRLWPLLDGVPARLVGIAEPATMRSRSTALLGVPAASPQDLDRDVDEDAALLRDLRPEVVVGDGRPSLSVSARLGLVPYVALGEASASPWAPRWPWGGSVAGQLVQRLLAPAEADAAVRQLARSLRRVCAARGVAPLWTGGAAGVLADGEGVAFTGPDGWLDLTGAPERAAWIGAPRWSPPVPAPAWLEDLAASGRPWIHVALGEDQDPAQLAAIVHALAGLGLPVVVATAGVRLAGPLPEGVHVAERLPEERVQAGAALMVGDGADGGFAALAAGVPVLAIARHERAVAAMRAAERQGCARCLRAGRASVARLAAAARLLIGRAEARSAAGRVQRRLAAYPAGECFAALLERVLAPVYC